MPKLVLAIVLSLALFAVACNDGREAEDQCDPAYPDVCIPSPPPDLDAETLASGTSKCSHLTRIASMATKTAWVASD